MDRITIERLAVDCVIGAWSWERHITQRLLIDVEMFADVSRAAASDALDDAVNYAAVAESVRDFVVSAQATLIERLAAGIAEKVHEDFDIAGVRVRVAKPGAVRDAATVAVTVTRGQVE